MLAYEVQLLFSLEPNFPLRITENFLQLYAFKENLTETYKYLNKAWNNLIPVLKSEINY